MQNVTVARQCTDLETVIAELLLILPATIVTGQQLVHGTVCRAVVVSRGDLDRLDASS